MDTVIVNITDINDVVTVNITDANDQITVVLSECISKIYVDGISIIGDGTYSNPLQSIGTGDMYKAIYDPTNISADAFDYNNFYNTPSIPAAQVNSDWNAVSGVAEILNKPTIPTNTSDLVNDGSDGINPFITANDITTQLQSDWNQADNTQVDFIKNKPTIPAAQVNSDWNANTGVSEILNKPSIPTNTSDLVNDGSNGIDQFITLNDIPSLTGYVPYTGATTNVDLGEYELKAGQIEFDQSPTGTAGVAITRWNNTIGSTETTLKGGNVILKNGVDLVARIVNKVTPNTTLTKAAYQVVRVSGAQGQRLAVEFAQANNDNNSADTLGIVIETIPTNQEGFILTVGQIEDINTTGSLQSETWADGDVLYLSPTTAGRITNIKPNGSTGHIVVVGYVEYAHAIHGKIYVKIMNGWELDELHNVYINTGTLANNNVLVYESATSLWKNKTIATILGYTPVNPTRTINTTSPLSGGGDLSADRTFSISQANTSTNGYLSSTDWNTFNNKQSALGYTPENVANKATTMTGNTGSNTLYLTSKAVYDWVISLGYITSAALVGYATQAWVSSQGFITNVISSLGYTPANKAGDTFTGAVTESVVTLTDASTIAVNALLGNIFTVTLGGNRMLGNPTGAVNGQRLTFRIRQDGTGNKTLSFDTKFRFGTDLTSITLSTGANKTDYIGVIYNSTDDKFDIVAIMKGY